MTGRPSSFTQATADAICERLASGESMLTISKDAGMPNRQTVSRWAKDNADFAASIASAREAGQDHLAEQALEEAVAAADAALGRLALDARRWYLSKLAPKRYGDKLDLTSAGDKLASSDPGAQIDRLAAIFEAAAKRP